jgi:EAL and modified HD-GYP domain-containing signal transduction protein
MAELARDDIEIDEVAELVSQDVGLAVKILSLINCPLYQLVREVKSVKDAVVILGLTTVKQWAITLAIVSGANRPVELYRIVLVRAKTLALYSDVLNIKDSSIDPSSCFLLGLLSGVDAIFEIEMVEVLNHLKLDNNIKAALLHEDNALGELLKNSIGVERFDSDVFEHLSSGELSLLNQCYKDALKWADGVMSYLG